MISKPLSTENLLAMETLLRKASAFLKHIAEDPKEMECHAYLTQLIEKIETIDQPDLLEFYLFDILSPELWALADRLNRRKSKTR